MLKLFLAAQLLAGQLYLGGHPAPTGVLDVYWNIATATGIVQPMIRGTVECKGDNKTFIGCMGAYIQARDRSDVTVNTKGVLYGLGISVVPIVDRNNVPLDDVAAIAAINDGTAKGTEAIYVGRNVNIAGSEWIDVFGSDANADWGMRLAGVLTQSAITTRYATLPTGRGLELGNNHSIAGLDVKETAWTNLIRLNNLEQVEIGAPWRVNVINGFSQFGAAPAVNNGILSGKQIVNGADTLFFQRNTDQTPGGSFIRFVNAGNSTNLFQVGIDGSVPIVKGEATFSGTKTIKAEIDCTLVFESGMLIGGTC